MDNEVKKPNVISWMIVLLIASVIVGIGFSLGNSIGWDIASFLGFAVG